MRFKALQLRQPAWLCLLLVAAAIGPACAAKPPKPALATGKSIAAKPAGQLLPARPHQRPDNASVTFVDGAGGFGDFSEIVERQSCAPGKHNCGGRGCCDDYENCAPNGCCAKPRVACGSGCYDPEEEVCCEDENATCDVGEACTDTGCCPEDHPAPCGGMCYDPDTKKCCDNGDICDKGDSCVGGSQCCGNGFYELCGDKCYDFVFSTCCTDGSSSWVCEYGSECCPETRGCVKSGDVCCSGGSCDGDGKCCEKECCDSDEECGENGLCTKTQDPTVTKTVTTESERTGGGGGSPNGFAGPNQISQSGGPAGWREMACQWIAFSAAAAVVVSYTSIF